MCFCAGQVEAKLLVGTRELVDYRHINLQSRSIYPLAKANARRSFINPCGAVVASRIDTLLYVATRPVGPASKRP